MREKAAAAAMLTPVTKAKIALAMMVATASRPGSQRLTRCASVYRSVAAPHLARKSPISMNSGMTAKI